MRGKNKLNVSIETESQVIVIPNKERRDTAMSARFYYHHALQGLRYERCLHELWKEFFVSEQTIIDILLRNSEEIKEMTKQNPTAKSLESLYPFFKW